MIGALVRLAARRCAGPSAVAILTLACAALVWSSREAPEGLDAGARAALARHESWLALGLVATVLLLQSSAALAADWRRRDCEAFGGAPRSRLAIACSSWSGAWLAATAAGVFALIAAEARRGGPALEREIERSPVSAGAAAFDDLRLSATLVPPSGARALELELGFVATDVFAELELSATRGELTTRAVQRIWSRTRMRVELPAGSGALQLQLARRSGGALVYLARDDVSWLGAARVGRLASVMAWSHWSLAFAALCALAFAFGAYLPAPLAAASALALALPAWLGEAQQWAAYSPWGGVPAALEALSRGAVPAPPSALQTLSGVVLVALALALAARGLASWRTRR